MSKQTFDERKQAVLDKFYGGERLPHYHNFRLSDGVCTNCQTFIGDANSRTCSVITPDEVALFRMEE